MTTRLEWICEHLRTHCCSRTQQCGWFVPVLQACREKGSHQLPWRRPSSRKRREGWPRTVETMEAAEAAEVMRR